MLWAAYPRKTQSAFFGPSLPFLEIGILTFTKHPNVQKYESDGFLPTQSSYGVAYLFLFGVLFRHDSQSIKLPPIMP
jgi:hypothetical protein